MSQLLRFDPAGAFISGTGIETAQVNDLSSTLEKLRDEICDVDVKMLSGAIPTPEAKQPLDAGFYLLPERLLSDYEADRQGSELARILAKTKKLMAEVDRVVVLGIGGSYMGAKALMDACCQPYFNEFNRGERGSKPRIYFEGNNVDNDASQGLLHLLGAHRQTVSTGIDDSWGLVVISKSGGTLETAAAFRQYLAALEISCGGDKQKLGDRLIPVTGSSGKLFNFATELGCDQIFLFQTSWRKILSAFGGWLSTRSADGYQCDEAVAGRQGDERAFSFGEGF
ncbi:MAG: hypothetical protein U0930_19350 [Pirellulales bacterium]